MLLSLLVSNYNFDIYYNDYIFLLIFLIFTFCVTLLLISISLLGSRKQIEFEKVSSYECGFEPFDVNTSFNVQFFIIGLSFLIFDLELIFLYPWALFVSILSVESFWIFSCFMFFVILGFMFEWKKGVLVWV
jgi:NADH-quinone oxidoreductase subunit A